MIQIHTNYYYRHVYQDTIRCVSAQLAKTGAASVDHHIQCLCIAAQKLLTGESDDCLIFTMIIDNITSKGIYLHSLHKAKLQIHFLIKDIMTGKRHNCDGAYHKHLQCIELAKLL